MHPHVDIDDPAQDQGLDQEMNRTHGPIIAQHKDSTSNQCGILLLFQLQFFIMNAG